MPLGYYTGNGGLCAQKKNRQGYLVDGCGDDFFDGIVHPDYVAHGPWWKPVWDRDLPKIQSLGANTIRVYHLNPYTKYLYQNFSQYYPNDLPQYAADHRPFMDAADSYGLKVVAPILSDPSFLQSASEAEIYRMVDARVEELGNHNALLMWNIGNEWGIDQNPTLRTIINKVIDRTKQTMLSRWNRLVPVMTAVIDNPNTYETLARQMKVDVFGVNAYRQAYVDTLWNPSGSFTGWKALSNTLQIPLLLSEFGWANTDQQTAKQPDWINMQIKQYYSKKVDGCVGGLYFEYNDETWKDTDGQAMGVTKFAVASSSSGKSNVKGVLIADLVQEKALFNYLAKGVANSIYSDYNFSNDVFKLTNTNRTSIEVVGEISDAEPETSSASHTLHTLIVFGVTILCILFI
jgi:beta-galactosidase/beta-glucuronidase